MSWIDDRLEQQKQEREHRRIIALNAEVIYNQLWAEIANFIEEAQAKGMDVIGNGTPLERTVTYDPPRSGGSRVLTVSFDRAAQFIAVRGLNSDFELRFDVCSHNRVCLKRGDSEILLRDAAQQILEPFIFPELTS